MARIRSYRKNGNVQHVFSLNFIKCHVVKQFVFPFELHPPLINLLLTNRLYIKRNLSELPYVINRSSLFYSVAFSAVSFIFRSVLSFLLSSPLFNFLLISLLRCSFVLPSVTISFLHFQKQNFYKASLASF